MKYKKVFLLFACALLYCGCAQTNSVNTRQYRADTVYINNHSADTLRIYNRDSIFVNAGADTVIIEKYHFNTVERVKIKNDTIYLTKVETMSEAKETAKKNYTPMILHIAGCILLIVILLIFKKHKKWI